MPVGFFLYSPGDKRVLLHKRDDNTASSPNKWDYFGGEIKPQESIKEALARELREELGITAAEGDISVLDEKDNVYYILFPKSGTGELRLGEGAGFAWFSFEEVDRLKDNITSGAKDLLRALQQKAATTGIT